MNLPWSKPLEKVLVAVDGSEDSALAVRAAADLSARAGAELHVVHAWRDEVPPSLPTALTGEFSEARERWEREAAEVLREHAKLAENAGTAAAGSAASPSSEAAKRTSRPGTQAASTKPPPESQPHSVAPKANAAKAAPAGAAHAGRRNPASAAAGPASKPSSKGSNTCSAVSIGLPSCPPPLARLVAQSRTRA
jgi:nucleotide-binding universal stress UspA family protein